MHEALQRLEQNLRAYRPYLPKSCLPAQLEEEHLCGSQRSPCSVATNSTGAASSKTEGSEQVDVPHIGVTKALGMLKATRATALVVNTCNVLESLEQDPRRFTLFFEVLLGAVMSAVEARGGLVDIFVGDRILASFNTSRLCVMHAAAAAGAAQHIIRAVRSDNTYKRGTRPHNAVHINIGAASGRVLCGDLGCAEMRRFSLLGTLPVVASGMERASRALGLDVLCTPGLCQDAEHEHVFLLVPRLVRLVKARARGSDSVRSAVQGCLRDDDDTYNSEGSSHAYELVVRDTAETATHGEEWMYHIGKAAAEWAPYNAAMRAFLTGCGVESAASRAGDHQRQAHTTICLLGSMIPLAVQV
eukprot:TRINITY_DN11226_c0_g1_i1.p1 TRINITY_DN11226_c0_g1~~TRINITY_DN11226_c0_g1_i1.p1  ORF type:complete len:392 (+),score=82.85 TRINITY_DN11226_c0_g1_i1:102-1178(+)